MNKFVYCDSSLCIGCGMCERHCIMVHEGLKLTEIDFSVPWQRARCKSYRTAQLKVAVHCRHCENAPCLAACPVGAIVHRAGELIFVDEARCIGCHECTLACPFGSIRLAPTRSGRLVATKCDLCRDVAAAPACVANCPKKALQLVDSAFLQQLLTKRQLDSIERD